MINRHKGRALPAGVDVGGAEIVHDRDADRPSERQRIADLDRQLFLGPVQHGLAVKADDVDVVEAHPVLRGKGGHRLGMRRCDDPLGLAQAAGPRRTIRQVGGLVQCLPQQAALRIGIGPVS